jgi:phosphoserine phosphatase
MRFLRILLTTLLLLGVLHAGDPLPSWNDGPAKDRILNFVEKVTQEGSPSYVAPADRIAVFDNDGTLWSERPLPFQIIYAIDRIKAMAPQHPEWKEQQPFKAILEGDKQSLLKQGKKGLLTILAAVYAGPDRIAMQKEVAQWLATAKHPRFHKPYGELRYKPMMELLRYLESKGFKNFVVSGGGIDFMRAYIPQDYGIPSERILGSYAETRFENGEIVKLPKVAYINDKAYKPIAIYRNIGLRPILAVGNSDGDLAMLQYSAAGRGENLQVYIHHTDGKREYAYDKMPVGTLEKGLVAAKKGDWLVVDMKNDWKEIF